MLGFYYVREEYVEFLRQFDSKVPNIGYDTHDKFFCGIVLQINNLDYYAPVSHSTKKQQTSLIIYDNGRAISSLKFSFMIPVHKDHLTKINFNDVAKTDPKYADLLRSEYAFCSAHEIEIRQKATSIYRIGTNKKHVLNKYCCQFDILEAHMFEYKGCKTNDKCKDNEFASAGDGLQESR